MADGEATQDPDLLPALPPEVVQQVAAETLGPGLTPEDLVADLVVQHRQRLGIVPCEHVPCGTVRGGKDRCARCGHRFTV